MKKKEPSEFNSTKDISGQVTIDQLASHSSTFIDQSKYNIYVEICRMIFNCLISPSLEIIKLKKRTRFNFKKELFRSIVEIVE